MKTCSIDDLRANFCFDAETGILSRRFTMGHLKAGEPVGHLCNRGYLLFVFRQRRYAVHRACFAMHYGRWPDGDIDHINCVKTDNRIANFREATTSQNQINCDLSSRNTSGYRGVCARYGMWRSRIYLNRKTIELGMCETPDEAAHAYNKAAIRLHGEFARLNPIGAAAPTPETKA